MHRYAYWSGICVEFNSRVFDVSLHRDLMWKSGVVWSRLLLFTWLWSLSHVTARLIVIAFYTLNCNKPEGNLWHMLCMEAQIQLFCFPSGQVRNFSLLSWTRNTYPDNDCKRAIEMIFYLFLHNLCLLLFLHKNVCCGYSLEAPHWGASNEYPQHTFL